MFAFANGKRWAPCNKGGEYRKWYGNKRCGGLERRWCSDDGPSVALKAAYGQRFATRNIISVTDNMVEN